MRNMREIFKKVSSRDFVEDAVKKTLLVAAGVFAWNLYMESRKETQEMKERLANFETGIGVFGSAGERLKLGLEKKFQPRANGVRGLEIQGKFIKFTAIGVYLEESVALKYLAAKWSTKTAEELSESPEFFLDIVTGPFEKFTQVTTILPLTGLQYSEKVSENCVAYWKSIGSYTDAEEKAIEKFLQVFKTENFPPGSSILFTQSPSGSLTISFSKHNEIPIEGNAVIDNKQLSEAVLESIIGEKGVSPEAKKSLATRISELFKEKHRDTKEHGVTNGKTEPEKDAEAAEKECKPAADAE